MKQSQGLPPGCLVRCIICNGVADGDPETAKAAGLPHHRCTCVCMRCGGDFDQYMSKTERLCQRCAQVSLLDARLACVESAKRFVQMTRQNDPEGEAEFLEELVKAVEEVKRREQGS